jgi:hypothetical protein
MLLVPDTHRPFHDERAWNLMMKAARFLKPKDITIIGDFGDFYSVSDKRKNPLRPQLLEHELRDVRQGLDDLDSLGAKTKRYIAGNHEHRLERYLEANAEALYETDCIPGKLGLKGRGWEYTPYLEHCAIGKLYLTHDVGTAGRMAVFKASDAFEHSVVTGHTHRMQYVVEGNALGTMRVSAMFGWLGDAKRADYTHMVRKKDWPLGFGVGHLDEKTGFVYLQPVPIVEYTCCVNGKLFRG